MKKFLRSKGNGSFARVHTSKMEVRNVEKEEKRKHKAKQLDREEFGFGMDLSPDDFDVIGQNDAAKKHNRQTDSLQTKGNQQNR